jgi:signal transduction histidine kinase
MTTLNPGGSQTDTQFVSRLVHDLRASLRAVNTLPDWIIEDLEAQSNSVPNDVYKYLRDIKSKAARADKLILSVREFCEINTTHECLVECDIKSTIKLAIDQFELPVGFKITSDLVDQTRNVPPVSLTRVMGLLLDNACRHHGADTGNIHVTNNRTQGAIWISDDGQGILEEYAAQVFEPFTTLKPQDVVEGSGFGLSIARKYSKGWNGDLHIVKNKTFSGTTIEVSFPTLP